VRTFARAILAVALGASLAAPATAQVNDEAFATTLRDALGSGEWKRVQPLFPRAATAPLDFLRLRWHDMRAGKLDPVAWDVSFKPYYALSSRLGGRLTITAREAGEKAVTGRFDVELVHRAQGWVLGEPLPIEQGEVRVKAHDLALDLRENELRCSDALTLEALGPDRRTFLTLAPSLKVKGAEWRGQPYPVVQHDELLYLEAPDAEGPQVVTVHYAGKLGGDRALIPAAAGWYPRPSDLRFAEFKLKLTVPPGTTGVAAGTPGELEKRPDAWTQTFAPLGPVDGLDVATGDFTAVKRFEALPNLTALVAPENEGVGVDLAEEARGVLSFYAKHYGACPRPELYVVQAGLKAGYSAGAVLALGAADLESQERAHEAVARGLAKAWVAQVRYRGTPIERRFMIEGVPAYMALLYRAQHEGPKAFRAGLAGAQVTLWEPMLEQVLASEEGVAPTDILGPAQADARSTLVLHMLRRHVGNAAFDEGFRKLWGTPGKLIDLAAFRQPFEQASGKNLSEFFRQWLTPERQWPNTLGMPAFELTDVEVLKQPGGRFLVRGVLEQPMPAYYLGVPIVVTTDKQQVLYEVPVRSQRTAFQLVARSRPRKLFVDPLHDLCAAPVEPQELPPPH
jgi:hypothetical protein